MAGALAAAALLGAGTTAVLTGSEGPDQVVARPASAPTSGAPAVTSSPSPSPSVSPSPSSVPPTTAPQPAPSTAPPVPQLDEEALATATVPSLCGHPSGRLRNGKLPGIPAGAGFVELDETALVDLDGDAVLEATVLLSCSAGNSVITSVHIYRSGPRLVGDVPIEAGLGSEARVTDIEAGRGRVEVSARFQDEDDGRCCPSGYVVRSFRLKGGKIQQVPGPGVDRQAQVTGDGWGTVRVGDTYEQLARATGIPVDIDLIDDVSDDLEAEPCTYVTLKGNDTVTVMGGEGRARAVVFSSPGVKSKSGVGVGSTEEQVLAAYGDRAERVPNTYGPIDDVVIAAGSGRIVRFEFDESRVVHSMHAGETEYASLIEGCA
jgi:hypothetical protein